MNAVTRGSLSHQPEAVQTLDALDSSLETWNSQGVFSDTEVQESNLPVIMKCNENSRGAQVSPPPPFTLSLVEFQNQKYPVPLEEIGSRAQALR